MKICTITCHNADNYGARLQAYALQRYLESEGHDVSIIDYEPDYLRFDGRLWYNPGLNVKEWAKLVLRYGLRRDAINKHLNLEKFSDEYLHLTCKYTSYDDLKSNPPDADMYIAGSDQIWNTIFKRGRDGAYYLDFVTDMSKCISYAASFGNSTIDPKYRDFMREMLGGIDKISIREQSSLKIINDLGFDAQVVCDPVFLLNEEEWADIANEEFSDKYVLIYDFENNKALHKDTIDFAKKQGLKVFSVSPVRIVGIDHNYSDCSPTTFVSLIKNARYVVCNSLHGCIFSIIFNREFYLFSRKDGLNDRMTELLSHYGLMSRLIGDQGILQLSAIDYAHVNSILQQDISRSKQWLNYALKS